MSAIESPELLMLALLGVCLVVPLSGGALVKGLMAGAAGLLLATVGLDPSHGAPRFTFGQLFLWDGLGLLPVALGLYAVPEALALVRGCAGPSAGEHSSGGTVREGIRATWAHLGLTLRCSLLGVGVGVLPGVGASVSQWMAYAHAAQGSRQRARFGQGEIEGVIAPGAASAATLGGALVPTLALGIPGSVASAFILGALVLVGLTPGPSFLRPEHAGGHLTLVFSFVWTIVLANALMTGVSFLLLGSLARIARLPPTYLFPLVLTFILLGAFAEKHAAGDLAVLAAMGTVGLAMSRLDWPKAPLLLGLVLGPLIERRLLISVAAHGAAWMLRPAVLAMAAVVVVVLARSAKGALARAPAARVRARGGLTADRASSVLLGLLAVAGLWVGKDLPWAAGLVPRALLAVLAALAVVQVRASSRALRAPRQESVADSVPVSEGRPVVDAAVLGWLLFFVASAWLFGMVIGAALSCAAFLRLVGREPWLGVALVTCALTALVYLLADLALGLPGGVISDMLSRVVSAGTLAAPVSPLPLSRLAGPWT